MLKPTVKASEFTKYGFELRQRTPKAGSVLFVESRRRKG